MLHRTDGSNIIVADLFIAFGDRHSTRTRIEGPFTRITMEHENGPILEAYRTDESKPVQLAIYFEGHDTWLMLDDQSYWTSWEITTPT